MNVTRTLLIAIYRALALPLTVGLSACGSSVTNLGNVGVAGNTPIVGSIANGIFRDSNVSGLKYFSTSQSGVTDTGGTFNYITGETVTFSVGDVTLGNSVEGSTVVTPRELVSNGTTLNPTVLNIVRFLMLLDSDGAPGNGIVISQDIQGRAGNWPQIDFSGDLPTQLNAPYDPNTNNSIMDDLSNTGETHILPTAPVAAQQLESSLRCTYSGAFGGAYGGGNDSGAIALYIDPITGNSDGFTAATPAVAGASPTILAFTHALPLRFDQATLPVITATTVNNSYSFQFADLDDLSGTWNANNNSGSGTFSASRGGTDQTVQYRFAGSYQRNDGTDAGVLGFGVPTVTDPTNISVTGQAFSVGTSVNANMSGTIVTSGPLGTLTAQTDDNKQFSGTMILDNTSPDYLTVSGTYTISANPANPPPPVGTFQARGCLVF